MALRNTDIAVNLDGQIRHFKGLLRTKDLTHGRLLPNVLTRVGFGSSRQNHAPPRINLNGHVGEHMLDGLKIPNGPTELLAVFCVDDGAV